MAFTALDALREGTGGQPISWVSLACELQRDWARAETVPAIVKDGAAHADLAPASP